eukprot:scaffold62381_cov24-Tisochrysis_lutea.AAC.3
MRLHVLEKGRSAPLQISSTEPCSFTLVLALARVFNASSIISKSARAASCALESRSRKLGRAVEVGSGDAQVGASLAQQHRVLRGDCHEDLGIGSALDWREPARLAPVEDDEARGAALDKQVTWVRVAVKDLAVHCERKRLDETCDDGAHLGLVRARTALLLGPTAHVFDVGAINVLHAKHALGDELREHLGHGDRGSEGRLAQRLPEVT